MSELVFSLDTPRRNRDIVGMDTAILKFPAAFESDGVIAIGALSLLLLGLFEEQAQALGELLHHAEFVITTNPATVEARGSMHDCDTCRAGVRTALRSLNAQPDRPLIVAALYWAGDNGQGSDA